MNESEPETRRFTVVAEHSEFGRSSVTIICPFCGTYVTAFLWSLAGSGKRCTCGAKLNRYGEARR